MDFLTIMALMGGLYGMFQSVRSGNSAADAATDASQAQLAAQAEALNYLKEQERIPTAYKNEALVRLGQLYGLQGDTSFINQKTPYPGFGQKVKNFGTFSGTERGIPGIQGTPYTPPTQVQPQPQVDPGYYAQGSQLEGLSESEKRDIYNKTSQKFSDLTGKNLSYEDWKKHMGDFTNPQVASANMQGLENIHAVGGPAPGTIKTPGGTVQLPGGEGTIIDVPGGGVQIPETGVTTGSPAENYIIGPGVDPRMPEVTDTGTTSSRMYPYQSQQQAQQALIDQAKASPLYEHLLSGREAGERAILRNQTAMGKLRSGSTAHALYDYNTQLQNNALMQSYNQQLSGLNQLAGLGTSPQNISSLISEMGATEAAGITGAAQAQQAGTQNALTGLFSLLGGLQSI